MTSNTHKLINKDIIILEEITSLTSKMCTLADQERWEEVGATDSVRKNLLHDLSGMEHRNSLSNPQYSKLIATLFEKDKALLEKVSAERDNFLKEGVSFQSQNAAKESYLSMLNLAPSRGY